MKIKKEYILLTVLILALAGYLFLKKRNQLHYTLPVTPVIAKADIVKLELQKGTQQTILTKKDNAWSISPGNYPADSEKIDKIISDINGFSINTLISESGDYLRYDLTEDKKITVKVHGEKGLLFTFAVGKRATTFKHTFVMIEGDKRVFQTQGNFRNDFDQGPQDLRDKKVMAFEKDAVVSLEIVDGSKVLNLKKRVSKDKDAEQKTAAAQTTVPGSWTTSTGKEVSETAMADLFSLLTGLQCDSYLENKKKQDFKDKDPLISITLRGEKGATLSIFEKNDHKDKDTGNPAISSGSSSPFILQKLKVEQIRKTLKELRGEKTETQAGPTGPVLQKDAE
jgi:hypothetical protein